MTFIIWRDRLKLNRKPGTLQGNLGQTLQDILFEAPGLLPSELGKGPGRPRSKAR